jgi:hypothetical protein
MQSSPWSLRIEPIASPAAAASGQPQLSVSSRGVLLSWIEREGAKATLKFSEYGPAGWSAARSVASGDNWFVNWADVPSVLRLPNGTIVGHWLEKSGQRTYASTFTGKENQSRNFVAFSRDAGRTFGAPTRVDDEGTLGRVDTELLDDGSALISWLESANRVTQFRVRRIEPSGARSSSVTVATVSSERASGYPRIARSGSQLVMAWVENQPGGRAGDVSRMQVRTAVAKLPAK